jgi:hypothetical protein
MNELACQLRVELDRLDRCDGLRDRAALLCCFGGLLELGFRHAGRVYACPQIDSLDGEAALDLLQVDSNVYGPS